MPSEMSALFATITATPESEARNRLIQACARGLLADPKAAEVVAATTVAGNNEESEAASALLFCALDEARMAAENDVPDGAILIEAVAAALSAHDAASPFPPPVRMRLAQIYARAGLAPPPFALLSPEVMTAPGPDDAAIEDVPDLDAALDEVIRTVGDDPRQVHAALDELYAGLEPDLRAMLVATTIARPRAVEARLGLYWLLDRHPAIRLAAAIALLQRADADGLPAAVGTRLPAIRKWLPDDPARAALDAAIRRFLRSSAARGGSRPPTIHSAVASLPDGVGAQSLVAAVEGGGQRGVAMLLLKQGHGVKDAFVVPCASASKQRRTIARVREEVETVDVTPAYVAEALSRGLGEGLALETPPAPGLVDMIAFWGADALVPQPADAEAVLAAIGAPESLESLSSAKRAALIEASGAWVDRFEQSDAWFEDTGPLRAAIGRARTEEGREAAVWKHLQTRRDWWARQFAVMAATLKAQVEPEPELWLSFAAVAQALLTGRQLKRTPIMRDIAAMTLETADAREAGAMPAPATAFPRSEVDAGGIDHLLAHAEIGEAYLQGYLTALAVSPLPPPAQAWLGRLIGGIEFPGEGALDRFLDGIVKKANRISDDAADPEIVGEWIAALDASGLRAWTAGFADLVEAASSAWPAKATAADDRRMLKDIAAVAKGADATTLRTVLPVWIARRHALRL